LALLLRPVLTAITVSWRRELSGAVPVSVSQAQILYALSPGPAHISQLARANGITGPSATVMVGRMEAAGLVQRRSDPNDGRSVLVELTASGQALLAEVSTTRAELLRARLETLSREDLATLALAIPALEHLQSAWERPGGAPIATRRG
jgi:DNA-binding MarR family transcriptional regulator